MATTTVTVDGVPYDVQIGDVPTPQGGLTAQIAAAIDAAENLHVGPDDPAMTGPGVWVETDGDEVVTFWIETGT